MLLHQRANHQYYYADRKQKPQKINMRVTTSQHETSGNIVCSVKM